MKKSCKVLKLLKSITFSLLSVVWSENKDLAAMALSIINISKESTYQKPKTVYISLKRCFLDIPLELTEK